MKTHSVLFTGAALLFLTVAAGAQESGGAGSSGTPSGGATSGGATSGGSSGMGETPPPPTSQETQSYAPPPAPVRILPGGWYLGLGAGWDNQNTIDLSDSFGDTGKLRTQDSPLILASVGFKFPGTGLRVEAEGGYDWHSFNSVDLDGTPYAAKGHVNLGSALFNAVYDIPLGDRWGISVGAGAGAGFADYKSGAPVNGSLSKTGFMWQGIAGISYRLTPQTDLFVDYRYRDAMTHASIAVSGGTDTVHNISENAVVAGLRWYLWSPAM